MSCEDEIARLKRRVAELEQELSSARKNNPGRTKIQQMSAEVVDSNPYRSVRHLSKSLTLYKSTCSESRSCLLQSADGSEAHGHRRQLPADQRFHRGYNRSGRGRKCHSRNADQMWNRKSECFNSTICIL